MALSHPLIYALETRFALPLANTSGNRDESLPPVDRSSSLYVIEEVAGTCFNAIRFFTGWSVSGRDKLGEQISGTF